MPYILTTTDAPCTRSAKNTTDQSLKTPRANKGATKQTSITGHPYKKADASTNHDNNNKRMPD